MSHWGFVIAAYAVATTVVAGLLAWSLASMRRAERAAAALRAK